MTIYEILQLAGVFGIFTFIIHIYQSIITRKDHFRFMQFLERMDERQERCQLETMQVLKRIDEGQERCHQESMRVLERIEKGQEACRLEALKVIGEVSKGVEQIGKGIEHLEELVNNKNKVKGDG